MEESVLLSPWVTVTSNQNYERVFPCTFMSMIQKKRVIGVPAQLIA